MNLNHQELRERYGFPEGVTFEQLPDEREESKHYRPWPPGPWDKEPFNKVVWVDPETDLDCMLIRGGMGAWCGYVGVREGHPAHSIPYNDVDVRVHGGLTFGAPCQEGARVCHHVEGRPEVYWLGFDTNHGGDLAPGMLALHRHMREKDGTPGLWHDDLEYDPRTGSKPHNGIWAETYRTVAYTKAEVEDLATQLRDYGRAR